MVAARNRTGDEPSQLAKHADTYRIDFGLYGINDHPFFIGYDSIGTHQLLQRLFGQRLVRRRSKLALELIHQSFTFFLAYGRLDIHFEHRPLMAGQLRQPKKKVFEAVGLFVGDLVIRPGRGYNHFAKR